VKTVNTNGAGDAYAAGMLFAIAKKLSIEKAGKIAAFISSKVVESKTATVEKSLALEIKKIIEEK
jgi:sugar/nucleoside kinase (ribokinase family)